MSTVLATACQPELENEFDSAELSSKVMPVQSKFGNAPKSTQFCRCARLEASSCRNLFHSCALPLNLDKFTSVEWVVGADKVLMWIPLHFYTVLG